MSKILERIKQLGLNLPDAPAPAANYVPFMISNKLIFVSGQIPMIENKLVQGKVGFDIDIPEAILAAKACGLAIIAQLNSATNNNLDNIKRIIPHREKSAVYMPDGYARASRKPGICMAQKVGAANIAAALKDPFLACSPVIAITGGPYTETRNRNTYQEIDDLAMFKSVTKSSVRINDPRQLPETLRQAFRISTTGKPGPSHIETVSYTHLTLPTKA